MNNKNPRFDAHRKQLDLLERQLAEQNDTFARARVELASLRDMRLVFESLPELTNRQRSIPRGVRV